MALLTALAVVGHLVSVAVRWRYFRNTVDPASAQTVSGDDSRGRKEFAERAWLCAWGGQANALGGIAMLCPNLASLLPALIVSGTIEYLLWSRSPLARNRAGLHAPDATAAHTTALSSMLAPLEVPPSESATAELESEPWIRSTQEGQTETGQRYLTGWVRFELSPDQKVATLTVGFSPAFAHAPDVELDQEMDTEEAHCQPQLEHVTPAGMRVAIKRTTTGVPLAGKLLWHASPAENASSTLRSRLP